MLSSIRRRATTRHPFLHEPPVLLFLLSTATRERPSSPTRHETLLEYGFTDAQIAVLARRAPNLLSPTAGPDLITSKMSYLRNDLGLDLPDLVKVVTSDPGVLQSSLDKTIIPSISYLRSVLGSRSDVIRAIVRGPWLLRPAHNTVAANVLVLKESFGVPDPSIARLLLTQPRTLMRTPSRFHQLLDSVLSAGFDPSTHMFVHAIHVKSSMSGPTWERKVQAYRSFGWTHKEALSAFRKFPFLYAYSEGRIKRELGFLMNVLGMKVAEVLTYCKLMAWSLEKTLKPRCCVLNVLMGKGLLRKGVGVSVFVALSKSAGQFERLYVERYHKEVPEVVDAYQGKIKFSGFDHKR